MAFQDRERPGQKLGGSLHSRQEASLGVFAQQKEGSRALASDPSPQVPISRPSWDMGLSQPRLSEEPGLVMEHKPGSASLPLSPPGVSSSTLSVNSQKWGCWGKDWCTYNLADVAKLPSMGLDQFTLHPAR